MDDYLFVAQKKHKRLRIDDFFAGLNTKHDQSVLSPKSAAEVYNFDFSSGALLDGCGLENCGIIAQYIKHIWRFSAPDGDILMFSREGGEIFYQKNGLHALGGVGVAGRVFAAEYRLHGRNVIVICSDQSPIVVWDGENPAYAVADSPRVRCLAMHEGLTFIAGADGFTVRYTDDPDPTNWNESLTESGILTFNDGWGQVNRMVSHLGNLYVFRDYGISKVSISGGVPKSTGLFAAGGRIFSNTVVQCGNKTVFLAEDGLYEFDGLSAKRLLSVLDGFVVPADDAAACWSGGKYFLACRINGQGVVGCESAPFVNNAMIACDLSGGYSISRGMDISCLAAAGGKTYAVHRGQIHSVCEGATLDGVPLTKCWRSAQSDFGSEKTKILREIHLETSGDIELTVFSESGSCSKAVAGSSVPQRVRLSIRGKRLSLQIKSEAAGARVSRVVLVYSET